jgi:hypothetical protein
LKTAINEWHEDKEDGGDMEEFFPTFLTSLTFLRLLRF